MSESSLSWVVITCSSHAALQQSRWADAWLRMMAVMIHVGSGPTKPTGSELFGKIPALFWGRVRVVLSGARRVQEVEIPGPTNKQKET